MNKGFYTSLVCILFASSVYGQTKVYPDAGSWNTFSINYSLNKKWAILFTEECRIRENYSRLNLFYTNIGIEYKLNKYFKTSIVYRSTQKFKDDNRFSLRHRIMWDVIAKYGINKWSVSYRHRLQVENRDIYSSIDGYIPEWYSRSKFEVNYQLTKKITPYFSTELRYQLHDPRSVNSDGTWHRIRYQGGIDCEWSKKSKFGIYYLIQYEFNIEAPENLYMTGLEYTLSLKKS